MELIHVSRCIAWKPGSRIKWRHFDNIIVDSSSIMNTVKLSLVSETEVVLSFIAMENV